MRLIVKVGSAVLSKGEGTLNSQAIEKIASQLRWATQEGHELILVSSGAIAAGMGRLGWKDRPRDLRHKQAAAAIGQWALMKAYEDAFRKFSIVPAQILLTREDLMSRQRYLNIRNTLLDLLSLKTLPIINENDSVSTEEIQFGDNDTLSAIIAAKVGADKLILLSNVPGVFEIDKKGQMTDRVIPVIDKVTVELERKVSKTRGSKLAVGGMRAKLIAARMAAAAGIETWISPGSDEDVLEKILHHGHQAGTRFVPRPDRFASRDAWIAFGRASRGSLTIDDGAVKAIAEKRKSLLPSGIRSIRGNFSVGDTISIKSVKGAEVARGLVNYSTDDVTTIRGHHSREIPILLGRSGASEVIHRDNLVLL